MRIAGPPNWHPRPDEDPMGRTFKAICLVCGKAARRQEGTYSVRYSCPRHPDAEIVFAFVPLPREVARNVTLIPSQDSVKVWVGNGWNKRRKKPIPEYVGAGQYSKRMMYQPR